MRPTLDTALDESLTLLETGRATLAECLERYPAYADDLRPLLEIALAVRNVPAPTPSPDACVAGRRRMLQALVEKKRRRATPSGLLRRYLGEVVTLFTGAGEPSVRRRELGFRLAAVTVAVLVLLAFVGVILLPWIGQGVTQAATLSQMDGRVEIRLAGDETWHLAWAGERVKAGDHIRTAPQSTATLTFFDGSTTVMEAETEIAIVQASPQQGDDGRILVLRQVVGQTYNCVHQQRDTAARFAIETPAAVIAVHGTGFSLAVDSEGITYLVVVDGQVSVTVQDATVVVLAGEEITLQPGQPLIPSLVSPPIPTATAIPISPSAVSIPSETPQPAGATEMSRPTRVPGFTEAPASTRAPAPTVAPQPTVVPPSTAQPQPTEVPAPTTMPEPSRVPPGQTKTPQPPGHGE